MMQWRVRPIQVKTAAAVGLAALLGMASVAAASPGTPAPSESTVKPTPDRSKVDASADPETDVADGANVAPQPPAGDQTATGTAGPDGTDAKAPPAANPGPCLTHGQRVSAIAHSTPPGPGHGAAVSAAAHDHTGECAHATDATEDPTNDAGDNATENAAAPPAESPTLPTSATPEDHHGEHHGPDTEGSQGHDGHGHQNG